MPGRREPQGLTRAPCIPNEIFPVSMRRRYGQQARCCRASVVPAMAAGCETRTPTVPPRARQGKRLHLRHGFLYDGHARNGGRFCLRVIKILTLGCWREEAPKARLATRRGVDRCLPWPCTETQGPSPCRLLFTKRSAGAEQCTQDQVHSSATYRSADGHAGHPSASPLALALSGGPRRAHRHAARAPGAPPGRTAQVGGRGGAVFKRGSGSLPRQACAKRCTRFPGAVPRFDVGRFAASRIAGTHHKVVKVVVKPVEHPEPATSGRVCGAN